MKGFDPKFKDLPDFILGITKEIWEDRQIHTLHHYYTEDIPVRAPAGLVVGNQAVISATLATLAEFPDRQLLGEDVIWSGDEDTGFLSSHRILSTATHLGSGAYGSPSGKKFVYRVIADCAARSNAIYDEWIIRDQGAIVAQLGVEPREFARHQIEAEGGPEHCNRPLTPESDAPLCYTGQGNDNEHGQQYSAVLTGIMDADLGTVERSYDRAVQLELPAGTTAHGWAEADRFWLGLRSSFPNASFTIHHQIGRSDPGQADRAALRWALHGKHEGRGAFGRPTGAEVHVMGLSHAEFGPWGIRREFVLIDETAIWKQILLHAG